jgi:hypothetical protein
MAVSPQPIYRAPKKVMRVISHRGYWKDPSERNLAVAFERSFELGFGTETDLRDHNGTIVISHDMPRSDSTPLTFEDMLAIHSSYDGDLPLLLNIKADGLQASVLEQLQRYTPPTYYLFDMSIPDLLVSTRAGLSCLTRYSDVETPPHFVEQTVGIWVDEFEQEWVTEEKLKMHASMGKDLFIVSPELHGRPHLPRWESYRAMSADVRARCTLCTDFPESAQEFFS